MYSLLVNVESILNSRPFNPLSNDPNDMTPLTSVHSLVGKIFMDIPNPNVTHLPEGRVSIYQRLQQIPQHFWKRWSFDYIIELQQQVKWKASQEKLQLGMLVLVRDDNVPLLKWRLGRVMKLHTSKDGVNRVATIKIADSVLKRCFSKLCPFPMSE
ncbi:hypothetical protein ILUMI_05944 [Ignelater luminosus]|uniref:DUF5641 domain-containing protein n=1 Tax=Ignelater luminosus TaxID=2038154 RepID=A0A8K0DAZ8_IGNLU|nr:hypothetical protein ILUMI_05944 [Ignelater luminosus]